MRSLTAIVVDDEEFARENLRALLREYCPDVEVLATCSTIDEARFAILNQQPELLFLDIKMPGGSGFDLIQSMDKRNFEVIFTTAFDEYAIEAFEHHAIGYLLKPILSSKLIASVQKAAQLTGKQQVDYQQLLLDLKQGSSRKRLPMPTAEGFEMIPPGEMLRLKAQGHHTVLYLTKGRERLLVKNLKELEPLLSNLDFFRIHRSHLINLAHVDKVIKEEGGFVVMSDGAELEISRRKRSELMRYLSP